MQGCQTGQFGAIHGCATVEQQFHDRRLTFPGRALEQGFSVLVGRVNQIRALLNQGLDAADFLLCCGDSRRRRSSSG